jgi:hypothetical protein
MEGQEAPVAEAILHVVPENPQIPHVAQNVEPAPVEEHGGHKGLRHIEETDLRNPVEVGDEDRHESVAKQKTFQAWPQRDLIKESQAIYGNEADRDVGIGA